MVPFISPSTPPDLTNQVNLPTGTRFSEYGGFHGDTWKATWQRDDGQIPVSVRVLRTHPSNNDLQEKYRREISAWADFTHPNIARLLGTVASFGLYQEFGMVSPWMNKGNLSAFLEREGATITVADRFQILSDIISGIAYIHNRGKLHGEITGMNVFVDSSKRAYLVGFGLSSGPAESDCSPTIDKSLRWRAAELVPAMDGALQGFSPVLTQACDVYSFGNIMLQTLSGKIPYHEIKSDAGVLMAIAQGIHPRRPNDGIMTDDYWNLIQLCWEKASDRPSAEEVRRNVTDFYEAMVREASTARLP
ncbi:kinase-like protein [Athelia psychrophila]|uniref:Kinase-like protein n=1 Tax=Athelia psychrophila TaxID=1759441 RepID=A0A165XE88_9AGAM|nr:kinase-like protein [Fibularhizoctonia sp. CBS 109695]